MTVCIQVNCDIVISLGTEMTDWGWGGGFPFCCVNDHLELHG